MSFDEPERPLPKSQYEGEDLSVTTDRELKGWYSYAVAAEVFAVVGVGSFLPVTLEQLAKERGHLWSDSSTSCVSLAAPRNGGDAASMMFRRDNIEDLKKKQCVVDLFGSQITTASFAMYTFSLAVLVQAVTLICFSSFADHGPYRKNLLIAFGLVGATMSALFIFITPAVYLIAPILVITGVTCLGSSFTLLNSFLPLLVAHHPSTNEFGSSDIALEPLNSSRRRKTHDPDKLAYELELSAKISSKGVGIGYIAAVFVQVLSILLLFALSKTSISKRSPSFSIRLVLFFVGIWWAIFIIPTYLWLRRRPGSPLPNTPKRNPTRLQTLHFYIKFSLTSFWSTLKTASKLRQIIFFLFAWFLLSDAIATISGTAVLFARTELHMETIPIALLSITAISFGIIGAFSWPRLATRFSWTPKTVILLCIAFMEIIPLYGLLGFLPLVKKIGFLGLQQQWEIFPIGALHGFIMGGISSYCRSFYGHLIPPGSEAAFYALYAVTDKGSSAVGPALVGSIVDRAGTIRPAFVFLAILVLMPGPLIWLVNVERGREDAANMAMTTGKDMADGRGDYAAFEVGSDADSLLGDEDEEEERPLDAAR